MSAITEINIIDKSFKLNQKIGKTKKLYFFFQII